MPHEPKKRHSRERQGKRRAAIHLDLPKSVKCKNCGEMRLHHTVCASCGFYKGEAIIVKKQKTTSQPAA